jgi:hypothetical protein
MQAILEPMIQRTDMRILTWLGCFASPLTGLNLVSLFSQHFVLGYFSSSLRDFAAYAVVGWKLASHNPGKMPALHWWASEAMKKSSSD